jgi:polyisoprenoid-binding protein YceI
MTTTNAAPARTTWTLDASHSTVEFVAKHMMITTVKGRFTDVSGEIHMDETHPDRSVATAELGVASINTGVGQRDDHLRSADFFDAANHPELTFVATAIRPVDEDAFAIDADLTMHGVTNPITLTAEVQGFEQDPWGNDRVGLEITGQLKRGDYGMTFNQALGSGNVLVSDKVRLSLDISAVRQA